RRRVAPDRHAIGTQHTRRVADRNAAGHRIRGTTHGNGVGTGRGTVTNGDRILPGSTAAVANRGTTHGCHRAIGADGSAIGGCRRHRGPDAGGHRVTALRAIVVVVAANDAVVVDAVVTRAIGIDFLADLITHQRQLLLRGRTARR